jgi:hypothetical protein
MARLRPKQNKAAAHVARPLRLPAEICVYAFASLRWALAADSAGGSRST